mgnify:CR=1 FL=1
MNLPKEYTEKMKKLLGNEYDSYIESFSQPRYYGLRANTLKVTPDELTSMVDWKLEQVPWCKEGFYYDGEMFVLQNALITMPDLLYTRTISYVYRCYA